MTSLKPEQQKRFAILERTCIEGCVIFFMVGIALEEIKRERFYLSKGFSDFPSYCESIGYSRRHCDRLITDAEVIKSLPENLRDTVQDARAARELSKIPPFLRPAVLVEAVKTFAGKVSAAAVRKFTPPPPKSKVGHLMSKPAEAKPIPPKKAPTNAPAARLSGPKDGTGLEVPREILALWNRSDEAQSLLTYLSAVRGALRKAQDEKDILFAEVDFGDDLAKLNQVYTDVQLARPFAVCPSCNGKLLSKSCICHGRGFVSEFYWKHNVSEETKKITGRK